MSTGARAAAAGELAAAVIVPVYRESPDRLARCLRSALAQERPGNLRVTVYLVSDDLCSHAPTLTHRDLRRLGTGRVGAGPSIARNLGLEHAIADGAQLCALLDSDDWFEPDKLERMAPLALEYGVAVDNARIDFEPAHPGAPTRAGTWLVPPVDAAAPDRRKDAPAQLRPLEFFLGIDNPLWPVFRTDVLGDLRFLPQLRFSEDSLFNACLVARAGGRAAWLPRALHHYRVRERSLSRSGDACANAEHAYARIVDYLGDPAELAWLSPSLRAQLLAAYQRKRRTNAAYAHWLGLPGHAGRSFQEFVATPAQAPSPTADSAGS